tara:strand:- start:4536 stop:4955 length:420 start_codon:yes stop_codon:yes gene_type:complete
MASVEIINIYELDKKARDDFKDFSHNGTNSFYRSEMKAGRLSLYGVIIDGLRIGSIGLRHDEMPHGGEMVVVAGGGTYRGQRLVPMVLDFLERFAVKYGEKSIRFHTKREALAILTMGLGYSEIDDGDPDEITMRKVLA